MSKLASSLGERLLSLDAPLSTAEFDRYRYELDRRLARALRRERLARWTMLALWAAVFGGLVLHAWLPTIAGMQPSELYGMVQAVLVIAAFVETAAYFARFRPALQRDAAEQQLAVLQDLTRKVDDLTRRLAERPEPR